jgi:hypothetical protein
MALTMGVDVMILVYLEFQKILAGSTNNSNIMVFVALNGPTISRDYFQLFKRLVHSIFFMGYSLYCNNIIFTITSSAATSK